uniref:Ion transport domain-containing protein n=1 Tax=Anabas testudineus TaxID=64144 RepID=A0AAQ6IKB6_ANATE
MCVSTLTCSSTYLDYVSMVVVLINCVILGLYTPCDDINLNLEVLESIIFVYFVVEMLIKMIALGIWGYKGSFLSNNWNKLDAFIIYGEVLEYVLASFNIQLQIGYIIKPMRLISRVPSMRDLVIVLLKTMPMLVNVLIIYMFVIHIFAVLGVQLWQGELRNRCYLGVDIRKTYNVSLKPYYRSSFDEKTPFLCSANNKGGMQHCNNVPRYSIHGEPCSLPAPSSKSAVPAPTGSSQNNCVNWNMFYNVCRAGDLNPHMGSTHFDSIGYAWITIFQVVTMEGWSEIMFYIMDTDSFWNVVIFIPITIIGSFIMMNVCAVVIATQFSESMRGGTEEQRGGAVSYTQLLYKITSCIKKIFCRHNRVHPRSSRIHPSLKHALRPINKQLRRIVKSKVFDRGVMFVVFISILTMAIEHYEQPVELTKMIHISNVIFMVLFTLELSTKLLALQWEFFSDRNNLFDIVIVFTGLWDISNNTDSKLSVLRTFRLLRFVRLVRFFPYLKRQLTVLRGTVEGAAPLFRLLFFVIFIFSLIGMHLFGCEFKFKTMYGAIVQDRKNFDSLLWAMVTVFQVLTLEDWNLVLYNAMATTSPWAALYFVAIIIFGKHVLLNVLVGIVVDKFQSKHHSGSTGEDSWIDSESSSSPDLTPENGSSQTEMSSSETRQGSSLSPSGSRKSSGINSTEDGCESAATHEDKRSMTGCRKVVHWFQERQNWSFYVFAPENRFRVFCLRMVLHRMFDNVILMFIFLSCIVIAMERPSIDPASIERLVLNVAGYVFSGVFLVEMLIKVVALGLLIGENSYCRSSWNVVDGLLVILSLDNIFVSMVTTSHDNMLGILKVLRLLRTLRPLRMIRQVPKLKLAVEALISSLKPIANIVIISCAFFFFFGILGTQLFKGKFYYCVGDDTRNITNKNECLSANYRWIRKDYNFDSLPQALMSLFVMYSKDGWVNIMYDGLDAVGIDQQPRRNHNEWMLLYFISFMIMSFFLLDMFIGVMVDTFHQCQLKQKQQTPGTKGPCEELEQMQYYERYTFVRRFIHNLCTSNNMDRIVTVIIFFSVVMMAVEHYKQPKDVEVLVVSSYYVFIALLSIEILLKLVAFGVRRFIKFRWNLLDVVVFLVCIIDISLTHVNMAEQIHFNPSILRTCRVLRLAHVLRAKRMRVLLKTIIKTLSQVGNICLLFIFFFFIYAALGVELFGKLECTPSNPCLAFNQYISFRNFGMALLTLYQVCTGDNWSLIMKDTLRECHPDEHHTCLAYMKWVAPLCLISFVIIAQFVLVNLVVASIMQAMEDSIQEEHMLTNNLPPPGRSITSSSSHVSADGSPEECPTPT